jgi:nicotinamidase-related amidase
MEGQALLIIDVQSALFQGPPVPHDAVNVLARINNLAARARAVGVPVLFVQHDGTQEDGLQPDSPGWHLHPALVRETRDLLVRKTACDAFFQSPLSKTLDQVGAQELIVAGYATEFCVDTTIRRAASQGFRVIVVSDAHTTKDRPVLPAVQIIAHHNWVLSNLIQPENPIRVLPTEEIVF